MAKPVHRRGVTHVALRNELVACTILAQLPRASRAAVAAVCRTWRAAAKWVHAPYAYREALRCGDAPTANQLWAYARALLVDASHGLRLLQFACQYGASADHVRGFVRDLSPSSGHVRHCIALACRYNHAHVFDALLDAATAHTHSFCSANEEWVGPCLLSEASAHPTMLRRVTARMPRNDCAHAVDALRTSCRNGNAAVVQELLPWFYARSSAHASPTTLDHHHYDHHLCWHQVLADVTQHPNAGPFAVELLSLALKNKHVAVAAVLVHDKRTLQLAHAENPDKVVCATAPHSTLFAHVVGRHGLTIACALKLLDRSAQSGPVQRSLVHALRNGGGVSADTARAMLLHLCRHLHASQVPVARALLARDDVRADNACLREACRTGRAPMVELLLRESGVDPSTEHAALCVAAERGHADVVAHLVRDARVVDAEQRALRLACTVSRNEAIVDALLSDARAAPALVLRSAAETPSNGAVVARLLADARVDPRAQHSAALRAAAAHKACGDAVRLLLCDRRADPAANDYEAVRIACANGNYVAFKHLQNDARVRAASAQWCASALLGATLGNHIGIVRALVRQRPPPPAEAIDAALRAIDERDGEVAATARAPVRKVLVRAASAPAVVGHNGNGRRETVVVGVVVGCEM